MSISYSGSRKEFNECSLEEKITLIEEDFTNIYLDDSFNRELYEKAVECFLNSEFFTKLSQEKKSELQKYFEDLNRVMESPKVSGKFKLPEQFYLNHLGKLLVDFKDIPDYFDFEKEFNMRIKRHKYELDNIRNNDNKFNEKIASLIWDIYQRDDLAIGVHGTTLQDDFDISVENCDFFKHGIMVNERYKNGDARRTVNFQDLPGKQWAFGHISFLELMNYEYSSRNNNQNNRTTANFSCIVVRPTNMRNTAYDSECPQEYSIVTPYTSIRTNDGHYLSGHLVKPEFILGVLKNNEQFVLNPKCDLDNLSKLNECIGKRNEEIAKKKEEEERAKVEKLGEETSDIPVTGKKKIVDLFKKIINFAQKKDKTVDTDLGERK